MTANAPQRIDPPFRIKICGVTRTEDVELICDAGADAIGLNFYEKSSRFVDLDVARRLRDCVADRLTVVGVWVNERVERILELTAELQLDVIQLHGDEPLDALRSFSQQTVVRAIRHPFSDAAVDALTTADHHGYPPALALIDAARPGQYGGTGTSLNWDAVALDRARLGKVPIALAGGLTPITVADGIARICPAAVDVASGVEASPGIKDTKKLTAFVRAASDALAKSG